MAKRENTFLGVFDTQAEVLNKVTELKAQGIQEKDMYVVGHDKDAFSMVENQTDIHADTVEAPEDQGFMGNFISSLSGESTSMDAFSDMGLNQEESEEYYRQVQNGRLVLYADSDYSDSYDKFNRAAGVNETSATDTTLGSTANTGGTTGTNEEEHLRLHEERLNVDKESVQTGEVNIGKRVVEDTETIEVPVEREEIYVERRPVDETASGTNAAYEENDTIHIPVTEERVNVTKKDVVAEEIVVGKEKVRDTEQVNETVRREVADIDEDNDNVTDKNDRKPL